MTQSGNPGHLSHTPAWAVSYLPGSHPAPQRSNHHPSSSQAVYVSPSKSSAGPSGAGAAGETETERDSPLPAPSASILRVSGLQRQHAWNMGGLRSTPFLRTPVSSCMPKVALPHLPPVPHPTSASIPAPALTGNTGSKLVGELREKVVVGTVLGGPEDDDGASIVHWGESAGSGGVRARGGRGWATPAGLTFHLRHCLVAQNRVFPTW